MQIVDSAESTARVVRKMLSDGEDQSHLLSSRARSEATSRGTPIGAKTPPAEHRTFRFYATDSTDKFKRLAARFLGRQVDHVEHVDLGG